MKVVSIVKAMTKLLKFSNSPMFINQYVPLWVINRSWVMPIRNHAHPIHGLVLDFAPPQSNTTIRFSWFVPFWLTLVLTHKLTDKQFPHHVALDNGITPPGWCHHHIQLLTQWPRCQWHLLSALGNHKIQMNKVINHDKKMLQIM